jgi:hypothetical protein
MKMANTKDTDISMYSMQDCQQTLMQVAAQIGLITVNNEGANLAYRNELSDLAAYVRRLDKRINKLKESKVVGLDGSPVVANDP